MNEQKKPVKACIIWMHGLGSNAEDMEGLSKELELSYPIHHVCLNAPVRPVTLNNNMPMQAWYDIKNLSLGAREDEKGILDAEALILEAIAEQISHGFAANEIFLAGFSQGGAMALFTGLRCKQPLAGIIALSCYMPLAKQSHTVQDLKTPLFTAYGQFDDVVLPDWSEQTIQWLHDKGYNRITEHNYPMAHSVCYEEVKDLSEWLDREIFLIPENPKEAP